MRDRRELLTSIGASRPQVEITLRLQFGDPDHAAAICGNKARQQISQPDILGFHGIAAGGELDSGPGELTNPPGKIEVCRRRMKRAQRLAVNHQRDRDMVGATDTIEMVLDVAGNEADLVEIIEVIDDLEFGRGRCLGGCARARGGKRCTESRKRAPQDIASMHDVLPTWIMSFELFAPECGEFLAVCHKLRTFTEFSAVDAENLVVGTGNQIVAGVVVGLVALSDPDSLEPDQCRLVVLRHRDFDAAALAIDATAEADFIAGFFGNHMTAKAA